MVLLSCCGFFCFVVVVGDRGLVVKATTCGGGGDGSEAKGEEVKCWSALRKRCNEAPGGEQDGYEREQCCSARLWR